VTPCHLLELLVEACPEAAARADYQGQYPLSLASQAGYTHKTGLDALYQAAPETFFVDVLDDYMDDGSSTISDSISDSNGHINGSSNGNSNVNSISKGNSNGNGNNSNSTGSCSKNAASQKELLSSLSMRNMVRGILLRNGNSNGNCDINGTGSSNAINGNSNDSGSSNDSNGNSNSTGSCSKNAASQKELLSKLSMRNTVRDTLIQANAVTALV
jgi:hypothetical protein